MKPNLIGDPRVFALEYGLTNVTHNDTVLYGPCRLYLANIPLGEVDNPIYFAHVLEELAGLAKQSQGDEALPKMPMTPLGLQRLVASQLSNTHDFFWMAGFDDFSKLCFRQGETLVVYWCLRPGLGKRPEYANYPSGVQVAVVPIATLNKVAQAFDAACKSLLAHFQQTQHDLAETRYHAAKSVLPEDHVELFKASRPYRKRDGQVIRYACDGEGHIHRFEPSAGQHYHWNGSTCGRTADGVERSFDVPLAVREMLGGKMPKR